MILIKRCLAPFLLAALASCATHKNAASEHPVLKDVFKDDFLVGAAIAPAQFTPSVKESAETAMVKEQFNTISPENVLKWGAVHPSLNRYNFTRADAYVNFGVSNHMFIVGHNLIWHNATPRWVFEDEAGKPLGRDALIQRMHDHISTVVGRYKGRIKGWDVVNEALDWDGSLRTNRWLQIIGEDYLVKAYQFAHEADPDLQLYYNEFNMEYLTKRAGAVRLIKKLQAAGIPLTAVGIQAHYRLNWPPTKVLGQTIDELSALGVKIMITELDVTVLPGARGSEEAQRLIDIRTRPELNPYTNGLPESVQQALTHRYADLFTEFLKHRRQITRVTFWCATDRDSWLNNWPIPGRTDYPLLFDRQCQPKPAFYSVIAVGEK